MTLQRQNNSPFLYAKFLHWHATKGWIWRMKSTGKTTVEEAETVGLEFERVAKQVAGNLNDMSRTRAESLVKGLIEVAGGDAAPAGGEPLRQFVERWVLSRKACSDSTRAVYRQKLGHLLTFLGPMADTGVHRIPVAALTAWQESLVAQFSPATVESYVSPAHRLFDRAFKEGLVERNPMQVVDRDERKLGEQQQRAPFDVDEITALIQQCRKEKNEEWETMIWFGLCTSARIQDCANMPVKALDAQRWTLTFAPRKTLRFGKVLTVPVVEPLKSRLRDLLARDVGKFWTPSLAAVRFPESLSEAFGRLCDRAGVGTAIRMQFARKMRTRTFHCLRHSLTTWMATAGVDTQLRMSITGHSTVKVHKGYTHEELAAQLRLQEQQRAALTAGLQRLMPAAEVQAARPAGGRSRRGGGK
jgi:integrase